MECQCQDWVHGVRALPHGETGYLLLTTEAGIQVRPAFLQGTHLKQAECPTLRRAPPWPAVQSQRVRGRKRGVQCPHRRGAGVGQAGPPPALRVVLPRGAQAGGGRGAGAKGARGRRRQPARALCARRGHRGDGGRRGQHVLRQQQRRAVGAQGEVRLLSACVCARRVRSSETSVRRRNDSSAAARRWARVCAHVTHPPARPPTRAASAHLGAQVDEVSRITGPVSFEHHQSPITALSSAYQSRGGR